MNFLRVRHCSNFTTEHYKEAAKNRENTYRFIAHLIKIGKPHECEEALLAFFAEVAKIAQAFSCADKTRLRPEEYYWLDGQLQINIRVIDMFRCHIALLVGQGEFYEAMKQFELPCSFFDLKKCVRSHSLIHPLRILRVTENMIVLEENPEAMSERRKYYDRLKSAAQTGGIPDITIPDYMIPTLMPPDEEDAIRQTGPHPPKLPPPPKDLVVKAPRSNPPKKNAIGRIVPSEFTGIAAPRQKKSERPKKNTQTSPAEQPSKKTSHPAEPPSEEDLDRAWDIFSSVHATEPSPPNNDDDGFPEEEPPSALQHALLSKPKKK